MPRAVTAASDPDVTLCAGRGLKLPRIARARLSVRRQRIDQLPPLRGVRLREEPDRRHRREVGIAVELVAVREGELQRLSDSVDVPGRVVAHALEIEALQDCDRLEQDRSLSPETRLEDFERAVPGLERAPSGLLHPALVACEVGLRHETARLANGLGDALGDIATIETVPPGINCGFAPALPVPLLGLAERAQRAPEIVLAEDAPVGGGGPPRALEGQPAGAGDSQP